MRNDWDNQTNYGTLRHEFFFLTEKFTSTGVLWKDFSTFALLCFRQEGVHGFYLKTNILTTK